MTSAPPSGLLPRLASAAAWLSPRRIRAHATLLALCLWGACAVDFSNLGIFDRAGNIKFQDFLSFYISGKLIAQGRAADLYHEEARTAEMLEIIRTRVGPDAFVRQDAKPVVGESEFSPAAHDLTNLRLPNLYGPQFGLLFVPLARFPFLVAARIWVALNLLLYAVCISAIWKSCSSLRSYRAPAILCAVAFPPLFHFFVRGQNSVLVLACFTVALLAFRADRGWLAGIALGLLAFKPQFLVAIPLLLLLAQAWKPLTALVASASAQWILARICFGPVIMGTYSDMLWGAPRWIAAAEVPAAPIQMHSLRAFWSLLIPWPQAVLALYALCSVAIVVLAAVIWKSPSPLALRFSALSLAAVLVNPHLFVYDLLALAPALFLLADWAMTEAHHRLTPALRLLIYLAVTLPLLGPLSYWTHLQLSVPVFVALLWLLSLLAPHQLDSNESRIV